MRHTRATAIGIAAVVGLMGMSACTPAPAKPTVLIYGDSLTVQSEDAINYLYGAKDHIVFRAYGGTSMCDWATGAAADRVIYKPTRVVLAFTGNVDGCVKTDYTAGKLEGVVANYDRSLRQIAGSFRGIPVTVIASPAMNNLIVPGWFPENGNPALNAMYKADSTELGLTYSTVADDSLTPGHRYTAYRPAYGTKAPLVLTRLSDGVHLTPYGCVYYAVALLG